MRFYLISSDLLKPSSMGKEPIQDIRTSRNCAEQLRAVLLQVSYQFSQTRSRRYTSLCSLGPSASVSRFVQSGFLLPCEKGVSERCCSVLWVTLDHPAGGFSQGACIRSDMSRLHYCLSWQRVVEWHGTALRSSYTRSLFCPGVFTEAKEDNNNHTEKHLYLDSRNARK